MGPTRVVGLKIPAQLVVHFLYRLIPGRPALDPRVLLEECTMEPFDEAVRLRSVDRRGAVLDPLELE